LADTAALGPLQHARPIRGGVGVPGRVTGVALDVERTQDQLDRLGGGGAEDGAVVEPGEGDERHVGHRPRGGHGALRLAAGVASHGQVERDLAAVERGAGEPHGAVGAGLVRQPPDPAEAFDPTQDEGAWPWQIAQRLGLRTDQVVVREVPREATAQLEPVEHFVAHRQEVGTQVAVAHQELAHVAAPLVRER
jgi:hypothetical protein